MWQRLKRRFCLTPAPGFLVAIYLSWRWGCRVSPSALIRLPFSLSIGRGSKIARCTIIASGKGVTIGEGVEIYDGAILNALDGEISIGNHSTVGPYAVIYGEGTVSIGSYVSIATHTTLVASNHNFADRDKYIRLQGSTAKGITIEDDVWIGSNCVILDGVEIGAGTVVAAGAVVNRSAPHHSVVGGVPARLIKAR